MRIESPGSIRLASESLPEGMRPPDRAIHRYEVVVEKAPAVESGLRWVGVTIVNLLVQEDVVVPGGDRIHGKDRVRGSILTTVKQGFGDSFDMAGQRNEQLTDSRPSSLHSSGSRRPDERPATHSGFADRPMRIAIASGTDALS